MRPNNAPTDEGSPRLPLHSPRLVLRRLAADDLEPFLDYRNDPNVARYQSWEGIARAEAIEFIARHGSSNPTRPGEWLQIAIALRPTGLLIGDCGLKVEADDVQQATF